MNRWDTLIVALCALLVGASFALARPAGGQAAVAVVQTRDGERLALPLDRSGEWQVHGRRGTTRIEILAGRARVADSPCMHKLCVRAGWLGRAGEGAACLPNGVTLRLEGDDDHGYDAIGL